MQQGDVGAPIRFELVNGLVPFSLPDGSVVELWIKQPSGRVLRRFFTITDATNGIVYYETVVGDLAEHGTYRFQARAILPDGDRVGFGPVDDQVGRNVFPSALYALPDPAVVRMAVPETLVS